MTLLSGFHHVAVVSSELDRLLEFYETVFDLRVIKEVVEDGRRHVALNLGAGRLLEALTPGSQPMPQPGHLDHFAFAVPTRKAFLEARRRLLQVGASDGAVKEYGPFWSLRFRNPDGAETAVVWPKDRRRGSEIRSPNESTPVHVDTVR